MKNPQDGEAHENLFQHLEVDGFARIACLNCSRAETKKNSERIKLFYRLTKATTEQRWRFVNIAWMERSKAARIVSVRAAKWTESR